MQPKIKFLTTGGTIDKVYFDAKSKYEVGHPNIEVVLKELNLSFDYSITSLFKKDSLEVTDNDREVIRDAVEKCSEEKIIITHGTDTMVATANYLQKNSQKACPAINKTVVLTGALEPAMFKTSDALFNIGASIAAVQTLYDAKKYGCFIVMNGRVFPHNRVVKDLDRNRFIETT